MLAEIPEIKKDKDYSSAVHLGFVMESGNI